jgi:predicted TIM-barrel fold metal-dependent hydrolase
MKIIDAHLHFCDWEGFNEIAKAAGHVNSAEHLGQAYKENNIVHGIVMGNKTLSLEDHVYPDFLSYCIGLDSMIFDKKRIAEQVALVRQHLQRPTCVGIKLYPGYNHFYVYEDFLQPFYDLAREFHKPVAIHTGLTATADALLKYSHPLTLDEAAVQNPDVQFIMCHIGNPFLQDAIAVMEKNRNVATDLSGLLEGKIPDMEQFFLKKRGYLNMLRDWLEYLDSFDRIMFGTDWPLANLGDYISFVKHIVPQDQWDAVFYDNAKEIYQLSV